MALSFLYLLFVRVSQLVRLACRGPRRTGDRGGHVAPRGVGAASPDRPASAASCGPGTARRAGTAAPPAPTQTPLRPARHAASLAPRSRPPAVDLPASPLGPATGPLRHRRPRPPTRQGEPHLGLPAGPRRARHHGH